MTLAKVAPARRGDLKAGSRDIVGRDGSNGVSRAADDRAFDSFTDLSQDVAQTRTFSALIESFVERGQSSKEADLIENRQSCCHESNTSLRGSSNLLPDSFTEPGFHQIL